jgi:hypothetical protein
MQGGATATALPLDTFSSRVCDTTLCYALLCWSKRKWDDVSGCSRTSPRRLDRVLSLALLKSPAIRPIWSAYRAQVRGGAD